MAKIIGIDLGTTNSAMAVVEGGKAKIIENREGNRTTPSVVAVKSDGERVVGQLAKRQAVTNPDNTISSVKRLIGRRFSDAEVQRDRKLLPYTMKEGRDGGTQVVMRDKEYTPQEISAMILQKLKADAEEYLGGPVTEAVITVPAYFDDSQRQATKDAGQIAGLNVRRIINEPTAAALAYGLDKQKNEKILVYDLGGGTFDVSVLEVGDNTVEVRATNGDTHLGGDDFDQLIINWIVAEFKRDQGIDLSLDKFALQRIKEAAEKAKHELSTTVETDVNEPFITTGEGGPKHLHLKLTRTKLEELVSPLIQGTLKPVEQALADAKINKGEIDEIILVGGQTRMPAVQKLIEDYFGKKPHKGINPDEVVALGAATQAGILQGDVKIYNPSKISQLVVDVFCPCGDGSEICADNIYSLHCRTIVGGSNIQLESDQLAAVLHERGIFYAPDYLVNAGGLVAVVAEYERKDDHFIDQHLSTIQNQLVVLIQESQEYNISPLSILNKKIKTIVDSWC